MGRMTMHRRRPVCASWVWPMPLAIGCLAACSSSSGLSTDTHQDAASTGLAGATSAGSDGHGGSTAAGGGAIASGGGGAGSGGSRDSVGAGGYTASSGTVTGVAGASGGAMTTTSGGVRASGGTNSGGNSLGGTAGGLSGAGGNTARDAGNSADVVPDVPRGDASSNERPALDIAPDAGSSDASSAAAQEYLKTFAEPYCTRLAECCTQQGFTTSGIGACEQSELGFVKHLNDGSSIIDPTTIQTILAQLKNSCDQPSYTLLASTTKGTRLSGDPCDDSAQCAGVPALCLASDGSSTGKCMTPPRGTAGDGCSVTCDDTTLCAWNTRAGKSPYSVCYDQDGLRCDPVGFTCVSITAPGAKCSDFSECGTHAECLNGTCQTKVNLGADCGTGPNCDNSLQCRRDGGAGYTCQKLSIAWGGSCSP